MAERAFSRSIHSHRCHYHVHGSQATTGMVVQDCDIGGVEVTVKVCGGNVKITFKVTEVCSIENGTKDNQNIDNEVRVEHR